MDNHNKISYIEMPSKDMEITKKFFTEVFEWTFTDYGPDYCSFSSQGTDGGFYRSGQTMNPDSGSALIVFYSRDLEATLKKVEKSRGKIIKPVYSFPGGRRFHFADPNNNEYAVWSE